MSKRYFLYCHIRCDKNVPFYVGTGTVNSSKNGKVGRYFRAYCKQNRNHLWNRVTKKTNYEVVILEESDSRSLIFEKEISLIEKYGRIINSSEGLLANITRGGDGAGGFKRSSEDRLNKSLSRISNEERDIIKSLYVLGHGVRTIASARNHCRKSVKKILEESKLFGNRYTVMREDGLKFKTEKSASEFMNCAKGYISMAISKNRKVLGFTWSKINEFDVNDAELERLKSLGYKIEIM